LLSLICFSCFFLCRQSQQWVSLLFFLIINSLLDKAELENTKNSNEEEEEEEMLDPVSEYYQNSKHWTALVEYCLNPQNYPNDVINFDNDFVVCRDLYPKARLHCLIMPRRFFKIRHSLLIY
jgi:hypothetical protein